MAQSDEKNTNNGAAQEVASNGGSISGPISGQADKGKNFEFDGLQAQATTNKTGNMDFILDIPLEITIELGRTKMLISELLKLGQGSIIELSKSTGETLEILANQRLIAKGDVVSVNDKYGIRLTEVVSPAERLEGLK